MTTNEGRLIRQTLKGFVDSGWMKMVAKLSTINFEGKDSGLYILAKQIHMS